jgi:hypothetical protein
MSWGAYVGSDLAKKPWMRMVSCEYSNTFGRLDRQAVVLKWMEENEKAEGQSAVWQGSFWFDRRYRRCLSD